MSNKENVVEVVFRNEKFEVNPEAFKSMKVQKDLALMEKNPANAFEALDIVLCGGFDDALMRIPEENGEVSEFGASADAFAAFLEVLAVELSAKN